MLLRLPPVGLSVPAKLKACPTLPGVKLMPLSTVPSAPPTLSLALPSPGHQLTNPAGIAVQEMAPVVPRYTSMMEFIGLSLTIVTGPLEKPLQDHQTEFVAGDVGLP